MSAVMVTGGLGVVGSWVIRQLVKQGIEVVTYSRHLDTSLVKDIADKVNWVAGDIMDLPNLIHTIKQYGIERIIHLSAVMSDPLEANPFMAYRINVDGTVNVLEAARLMDVKRVVFTSSVAVYGQARGEYAFPTYKPIDEEYPKAPSSLYGATKLFGEHMCLSYNRIYGLDTVILRFASIYGPGKQTRHGALALHSRIIESAMLKEPFKLPQGGDETWDMIYTRDVASGIVLAAFAENLEHRIFHIGTGKGDSLRHLAEILRDLLGTIPLEIGTGLNPLGSEKTKYSYRVFNIERARIELGYHPQYDLEAATKDYIDTMKRLEISPTVVS